MTTAWTSASLQCLVRAENVFRRHAVLVLFDNDVQANPTFADVHRAPFDHSQGRTVGVEWKQFAQFALEHEPGLRRIQAPWRIVHRFRYSMPTRPSAVARTDSGPTPRSRRIPEAGPSDATHVKFVNQSNWEEILTGSVSGCVVCSSYPLFVRGRVDPTQSDPNNSSPQSSQ